MSWRYVCLALLLAGIPLFGLPRSLAAAEEGDKFRVVFVAGKPSHGYGAHEHYAGCVLLARTLEESMANFEVAVHRNGWPEDPAVFDGADAIVIYSDGGGGHPVLPHLEQVQHLIDRGVGLVCLHYAVEVPKGEPGNRFLEWIGGYFETHWSVNPHWVAKFEQLPEHPITRGVEPFEIDDEWYYHMRFPENMERVTPILTAIPPAHTLERPDGPHSGNPHVRAKQGQPQHVAWAIERENGGRGFGFTGGHHHWNWGDPNFRKIVLNAIVWTARAEVPEQGVQPRAVTLSDLEANQDFPQPENFDRDAVRKRIGLPEEDKQGATSPTLETQTAGAPARSRGDRDPRHPDSAVAGLDVADGLEATLFASEPALLSLTNLDIDHRGRVWVCEVVNYRGHAGKRPEGDRILILEDKDGDGRADETKVYYQGSDIDSAMGICVLGNKTIVSASPNILVFTDEDGDDVPDRKEVLFSNTGQPQHDHSAHSFLFGPDGMLYWNFGNTGQKVCDKDGNVIVDKAGNEVIDDGQPYYGGMPFRCALDGSQFEVLAHNFRNNYEVTVDSFGTLWQSDNDDDGNRGVRINYVMEFGNYGYKDELTGAGWQSPRTNMEPEIPLRHWHLNDPGVVPNLLQTGAGSPTGICVYEGRLLPEVFWDQVLHCDAGPNVVRAYPVKKRGAGYEAEIVNLVHGARDNWFRPADVCVAPDGSVFITDWYDPGVGGHAMGDLERGRLFRVAPPGHAYRPPAFDFTTIDGAIEALRNPNLATRYMAYTALEQFRAEAEGALEHVFSSDENPRIRARTLWLLGRIEGRGAHYVERALNDRDPDLRITGLRLARRLELPITPLIAKRLPNERDPQVLRECAIALRYEPAEKSAELWAELALRHTGDDRWYLEALGIGADGKWDALLDAWLARIDDPCGSEAARDIVWRSRAKQTPELLARIIANPATPTETLPRYFRAMDFQSSPAKRAALLQLAFDVPSDDAQRSALVFTESLRRLDPAEVTRPERRPAALARLAAMPRGADYTELALRFEFKELFPELVQLALEHADDSLGIEVVRQLLGRGEGHRFAELLESTDLDVALRTVTALGNSSDGNALPLLMQLVTDDRYDLELRRQATMAAARHVAGAQQLLALAERNELAVSLKEAAASALNGSPSDEIRAAAAKYFPLPASKDDKPLPPIAQLVAARGDAERGRQVFATHGQCASCHQVGSVGKEVGPALNDIGAKLSRQALIESILFPSAGISHNYETYALELEDGNIVTGLLVSRTDDMITIKTEDALIRRFPLSEVANVHKRNVSLMPADLQKSMTEQDLVDVVEYLTTLR